MATVVQKPRDTTKEDIGNALAGAIDKIIAGRDKGIKEQATQQALHTAASAPDYTSAIHGLISQLPPDTSPDDLAKLVSVTAEAHRGTQPETPTDAARIFSDYQTNITRIQETAATAKAARDSAEAIAKSNRESADSRNKANIQGRAEQPQIESAQKYVTSTKDEGTFASSLKGHLAALDTLNVNTGPGTPIFAALASGARQVGFDPSAFEKKAGINAADVQAFRSQSNAATLAQLGGHLGSGMSEGDRNFSVGIGPQLTNTPEGNALVSEFLKAQADKAENIAKVAADMEQKKADPREIQAEITRLKQIDIATPELQARAEAIRKKYANQQGAAKPDPNTQSVDYTGIKPGTKITNPDGSVTTYNGPMQ